MIIAFSGTDGAGKSTQIVALRSRLSERGVRTIYIWSRGGYTPIYSGLKRLVLTAMGRRGGKLMDPSKSTDYNRRRKLAFNRPWIARLWLILAILDLSILHAIYVRVLRFMGFTIVLDRHLIDTRLDFLRHHANVFSENLLIWKLLMLVCPKPDVHFLITVPVDVTVARSRQKKEPFPDNRETLEFRLTAYETYAYSARDDIIHLDGREPLDDLFSIIDQHVSALGIVYR